MRRRLIPAVWTCWSLGLGALIAAPSALAATLTVDSTADAGDSTPGDGECATEAGFCTLRAAIQEANRLPGADVIRLPANTYVINLEGSDEDHCLTGDLDITSSISITGDGAAHTIVDANFRDRVFDVGAAGAAVITGVTVQNGSATAGAGLRVDGGTLKLVECTVRGNQAGDRGGGLANDVGVLTVVRSTVSENVAHVSGGGIDNTGTALLANATVSGNVADVIGGGICNLGTATLNNTTVSANTLSGVDTDGQFVLVNSILADNAGPDCQGTLTSGGFNLIHDPTGCTFDGDTSGNLIQMEANLSPLQDNGGPTFTHALLEGSAAIDGASPATPGSGNGACETTDQRGVTRPQGPRCDIGAFEVSPCGNDVVDANEQCDDGNLADGDGCDSNCTATACGNDIVTGDEECDNGASNGTAGDPCDATCQLVEDGTGLAPRCCDGVLDPGEECDDGNEEDEDGCSTTCELEAPLSCDEVECDEESCDPATRFEIVNCILESPVCDGDELPGSLTRRIAKAREVLAFAWHAENPQRAKKLLAKAAKILRKAAVVRAGIVRRGGLSPECAAALSEMLGQAQSELLRWRVAVRAAA